MGRRVVENVSSNEVGSGDVGKVLDYHLLMDEVGLG